MSFFTPPLKQKSGSSNGHSKLSLTLSQGKKKRIVKHLDMKDADMSDSDKAIAKNITAMESANDESSSSSDSECEVFFDSKPAKEVLPEQSANNFALDFQVSSVAVDRAGRFVVAGFNNGTIRLYPLKNNAPSVPIVVGSLETDETASIDENKLVFRKGVVLEHISARGMYTQLRVNVVIPDDGRFIFAGVYRGSTEILVIDIDSIRLPTDIIGVPTAEVNTHSYSDAKLRGFGAVRCMPGKSSITTEYQVLCGLGIKNLHLWRFYWDPSCDDPESKWTWQCIFDRQTNGISLEYLAFGTEPNQLISKSEHQQVRVWTIDETTDAMNFDYNDIKQTQDTVQVCGQYAYGGQERLAMVNLDTAQRIELDLPSSVSPVARPTLNNRKRQLRTLSLLTGVPAGITLGVCSDGSVFVHDTSSETGLGIHTPPTSVTGYESFYQDQAGGGLLSLLPFEGSNDMMEWLVVMANSSQLQVQALHEFLHLPQKIKAPDTTAIKPLKLKSTKGKPLLSSQLVENVARPPPPSPPLKRTLDRSLEKKKSKKTSKDKPRSSWNYEVPTSPKKKQREQQPPTSPVLKKQRKELLVATPPPIQAAQPSPKATLVVVTPKIDLDAPPPVNFVDAMTPQKAPKVHCANVSVPEADAFHTPQPKKVNCREKSVVLSPVVSISPASSPCPLHTPQYSPSMPTPAANNKDWSPFVIPKRNKFPILDEEVVEKPQAARELDPEPEPEAEPAAHAPIEQVMEVEQVPRPMTPTVVCENAMVVEMPTVVLDLPVDCAMDVVAASDDEVDASKDVRSLLVRTATCQLEANVMEQCMSMPLFDSLTSIPNVDDVLCVVDTEVANATTNRFHTERANLMTKFQAAHQILIRSVCSDMHRKKLPGRVDACVIRKHFQLRVAELMGQQRLEADALYASHHMQWTVLGLGGFDMPRLVPVFPAPRLFG
ncbi:Aste57867_5072 [Aphanomyces stellatus]|uniref:Aste57867_5072 protein n=1 Tax=Aphanomyces stellatus TaxID=120398 RepID=A0A485KDY9_9STRA|nr:hypothetical protein As57867_005059 [Aphanomyces stellatus]VFT82153.1 Aste57867_5072 [Aphanomyces stellatus]